MKTIKLRIKNKIMMFLAIIFASFGNVMADTGAYLEITLKIEDENRASAVEVYKKYKSKFLNTIKGASSKELLVRKEDVQVLHGFKNLDDAKAYLDSKLFKADVVTGLKPLLKAAPEIRIYKLIK